MNSELLKERESFKRKALAAASVAAPAKKASKQSSSKSDHVKKSPKAAVESSAKAKLDLAQLKSMGQASSQFRFGVLAKIVRHMRKRHMDGEDQPLTLEEILDETNQLDTNAKTKMWLETEALKSNPKISASTSLNGTTTYLFKPPFSVTNKKGLIKLLVKYDLKGLGGIYLEELQESIPKCDKIIKQLSDESKIIVLNRPTDKRKVVFHHDHTTDFEVDPEFQKLWRSVAVDSVDDDKINEYLEKQGIRSMQDQGIRKMVPIRKPNRKAAQRKKRAPKDNEHIADVLEDYSELTAEKAKK